MSHELKDLSVRFDGLSTTRRKFLVHTGLAAAAMVISAGASSTTVYATSKTNESSHQHPSGRQFELKSEPQRERKSFHDLSEEEVVLLCRAIGYMRNGNGSTDKPANKILSVDSPIQWENWVKVHARHCTETNPGVIDQVHWSWFFLPWHRAYLWFLERHLANVITQVFGEDGSTFALPYWDWITHKEMPNTRLRVAKGLASPLFGYDLTKENMVSSDGLEFDNLALWDGYRKPTVVEPTMDPKNERTQDSKEHIEETIQFMSAQFIQFMLALDFEDFAGRAVEPQAKIPNPDGMGILEHYPHNNGHDWVGSRFGRNRDMGTLRYAALDPIFFMHHANIDRIWSWYRGAQPDPTKPWGSHKYIWGKQPYTFIDIDGSPVTVTVADIVTSMTNVRYREPQSPPAETAQLLSEVHAPQKQLQAKIVPLVREEKTITTTPLTLSVAPRVETQSFFSSLTSKPNPLSLLVIETGPVTYTGKFTVRVFVNMTNADANTSTHDPHYVGRIRALDSEARAQEAGKDFTHSFSIVIPPGQSNFYKLVKPGQAFSITLVALGPSMTDKSFQIPVKSINLKVFE